MKSSEPTIQVKRVIKKELDLLKLHKKESYNEVIERLIVAGTENEELSPETMRHIECSLKEIKVGKYVSLEEVKKKVRTHIPSKKLIKV